MQHAEIRQPHFARAFSLSADLDSSKIEANLQDGVIVLFVQNLAVSPKAFIHNAFRQARTCWPLRMRGGRNISARDSDRAISLGARDAGLGISLCGK
ncbi:hypothetical protein CBM2634_U140011 [Cupriavidus taiwanensis]|uniref:SHSP domain-containing protein n=1 Tax=Cupriavidus taiwanensis TaxID=164546 RepID=A0A375JD90_9BURK|nr:hypothetical protein CBM2634_U140011 [Cupriavidus taiwanensis]